MIKKLRINNLRTITLLIALFFFTAFAFEIVSRVSLEKRNEEVDIKNEYYEFRKELGEFFAATESIKNGIEAFITSDVTLDEATTDLVLSSLVENRHKMIKSIAVSEGTEYKWIYPKNSDYVSFEDNTYSSDQGKMDFYLSNHLQPKLKRFATENDDYLVVYIPIMKENQLYGRLEIYVQPVASTYIESIHIQQADIRIEITDNHETLVFGEDIHNQNPSMFEWEHSTGTWKFYFIPQDGWTNFTIITVLSILVLMLVTFLIFHGLYRLLSSYQSALHEKENYVQKSITDPLTGISNRSYFEQVVKQEFARSDRENTSLSLIYFDIDNFKDINDTFGHAIGDNILVSFANVIKSILRVGDYFARWGGDEFIILLANLDQKKTMHVANKVLSAIREGDYGLKVNVTASMGVSIRARNEYYSSIFRRTDNALYIAKEKGRNRIEFNVYDPYNVDISIPWIDTWRCGHHVIDEQHKQLTVKANKLVQMYSLKNDVTSDVLEALNDLIKSIKDHFNYEVSILREANYRDVEQHNDVHTALIQDIERLQVDFSEGNMEIRQFFHHLLNEIVINHLLEEDIKFFKHIKEHLKE